MDISGFSRSRWGVALATMAALLTLGGLAGCEMVPVEPQDGSGAGAGKTVGDPEAAQARLTNLKVAKAASMRGYSREKFAHWRSAGKNCDVRDTVLKRDGTKVRTSGCNVVAGTWDSVYDDLSLTDPAKVDVDHMVPLANAWRSGAATWTDAQRSDFANDLDRPQLIAVSATSNRAKGDQDPSTWKPKVTGIWCQYAQDWIAVKSHWTLSVTAAEKAALTDMLEKC